MCGITGILDWKRFPQTNDIQQAVEQMRPRGPDHQAVLTDGAIAFGHTRLAVIDLNPQSNQPMRDAEGGCLLVFNGEIYNYRELRRELEALGARFRTDSDTEVILKAYNAWSTNFITRLNGMFAFALWDPRKETLLLARDRLGDRTGIWRNISAPSKTTGMRTKPQNN
jgi:asparagine synthase (glutamine-hydrolysing)